ncbi:MAG: hypothetical protein ACREMA_00060 [Longimicrobiales bacterium]
MLSRCIYCRVALPENQTLEHLRLGTRLAFDPSRGRLWVVCATCRRWNLAPIEERWEALEALERLTRDRGRLLSQTDHIALLRAEDLEIVRVGKARLVEEAWWRYGSELQRRNRRFRAVRAAQWVLMLGASSTIGIGWMFMGGDPLNDLIRWRKFGSTAWRGLRSCRGCGRPMQELSFKRARHLVIAPSDTQLTLELRCRRCGFRNVDGGFAFEGLEAERMLRSVLAYHNFKGGSEADVKAAVSAIDELGSPQWLIRKLSRQGYEVAQGRKMKQTAIALEIAVNDEAERQLLEMELAELEARWREEEELAAIVDGELTEVPLLERLRVKLPG